MLVNIAAQKDGQVALLQAPVAAAAMEFVLEVIQPPAGAQKPASQHLDLALLMLRNLCFAPEAKAHILAHPHLLPALLNHAEHVSEAPRAAAAASSALWVLVYHGEKVGVWTFHVGLHRGNVIH